VQQLHILPLNLLFLQLIQQARTARTQRHNDDDDDDDMNPGDGDTNKSAAAESIQLSLVIIIMRHSAYSTQTGTVAVITSIIQPSLHANNWPV